MGHTQGSKGLANLSDDIRKVCLKGQTSVDLEEYEKGFAMGWNEYCTPFHGFDNGRKGDLYKSFCPPEKEELYREKFLVGKKVYEKKDQVIEVKEKIKELNSNTDRDNSTKDELNKLEEYLRLLNREIQSLEQNGMSPVHKD